MMTWKGTRLALVSTALFAGALCLSPVAATVEGGDPFPTPSEGLLIRGEVRGRSDAERQTLYDLLVRFGEVTGESLHISGDTEMILKSTQSGLLRDLEVAPADVYTVVESILIANRFAMTDLKRGEPRMLVISSLDSPARSLIRGDARYVPSEDLAAYVDHPALMIQTVLTFEHLDVRTMGNSMRAIVVDPNTMQLIPVPEGGGLIVVGFGPAVNNIARILEEVEERVAKRARLREEHEEHGEHQESDDDD